MLQSKEFNQKTLTFRQSPSNKSFTGKIMGNFAYQSPRGNMHKLFDFMKTPLKHFLACLTFQRKEIRLCHLHKKMNPASAPDWVAWALVTWLHGKLRTLYPTFTKTTITKLGWNTYVNKMISFPFVTWFIIIRFYIPICHFCMSRDHVIYWNFIAQLPRTM